MPPKRIVKRAARPGAARAGIPRKPGPSSTGHVPRKGGYAGHRHTHEAIETVSREMENRRRPPTQAEDTTFARPRPINKELEYGLRDLGIKLELSVADKKQTQYRHLNDNRQLLALREELLELIKNGHIKNPGQLNEMLEQLLDKKVEERQMDPQTKDTIMEGIQKNHPEFRLFTKQESAKLKVFFGKFHRQANISGMSA